MHATDFVPIDNFYYNDSFYDAYDLIKDVEKAEGIKLTFDQALEIIKNDKLEYALALLEKIENAIDRI